MRTSTKRASGALSMRFGFSLCHVWLTSSTSFVGNAAVRTKYERSGSRR